jgi:hypothetical protein
MRKFIGLMIMTICFEAAAQTNEATNNKFISLTGGRSTHGTGDMKGVTQKVIFGKYFKKKLFWFSSIGADIHDGKYLITSTQPDGKFSDNSFRYTSGAIQVAGGVGFSVLRSKKSELGVKIGGLLRYQSSSYFDQLLIIADPQRPSPAIYIFNTSPQRTYAIGVGPELFFHQSIAGSIYGGLSTGFQIDTNGDVLTNISLSIGKQLK